MAKKKRGPRKFTLPMAPILGLLAGSKDAIQMVVDGDYDGAVTNLIGNYTGYDTRTKKWWAPNMAKGLLPLIIGILVHKYVGGTPLNVNRMLASANVPIVRI